MMIIKNKLKILVHIFHIFFLVLYSCKTEEKKQKNESNKAEEIVTKVLDTLPVKFDKRVHDFGKIKQNKEVNTSFVFTNIGDEPLIISDVQITCGCTISEWSKEEIKIGEKGQIKIIYDAKAPFDFYKTISVFYVGNDTPIELIIKGEVLLPEIIKSI